jgi:DNA-binding response OmpR family regulator
LSPPSKNAWVELLVVEPDFLLRRTVVGVLRGMGLRSVHEALHLDRARERLAAQPYGALLLVLDEQRDALQLLRRLREGALPSDDRIPVAMTAAACDGSLAVELKVLDVQRLVLKPCKVRTLLETVDALVRLPVEVG